MNLAEYEKVKDMTYREYCAYLKNKYGKSKYDYMTASWNKNPKVTRTSEGLLVHHEYEDHGIMLGNKAYAMKNPFAWQKAENLVYCDYLEHLFLHVLICEYPAPDHNPNEAVGIGGALNHLIPELNDLYSGMPISQQWRRNCFDLVKNDVDCYITLVRRLKERSSDYPLYDEKQLYASDGENYGIWSAEKNKALCRQF